MHTLIHAFIASHIDYCNAVLYGVTNALIRRLQAVFHSILQLITGVWQNDHITPILHSCTTLHWLPVSECITFKIELMTLDSLWMITSIFLWCLCTGRLPLLFLLWQLQGRHRATYSVCALWSFKDRNICWKPFESGLTTWLFVQAYS